MVLLIYFVPILFQLFLKYIFKNKFSIFFVINFLILLIIGICHSNIIEKELIKSNFHCGMPLIVPFFLTIIFEIILIVIFIIQFIIFRKNVNSK